MTSAPDTALQMSSAPPGGWFIETFLDRGDSTNYFHPKTGFGFPISTPRQAGNEIIMSDNIPYVSIGLPVYNRERFLRETLDSLLAQSFEDFELIISDNGSTDGTGEICTEYASKDCRIRYYRNDNNMGAAWNFNRVFELAVGKYFRWAASDDLCAPDYLLRCVEVLDRNPACVLCFPQTVMIDEFGNDIGNNVTGLNLTSPKVHERYKQFHKSVSYSLIRIVPVAFALMRSCVLKTTPLVGAYVGSDVPLGAEFALRGDFCEIPEPLFYQRMHAEDSTSGNEGRPEKIAVWYDPKNKGKIVFPRWKWLFEFLRSIRRVEMSPKEKTLCYMQVGQWALWWYKGLAYDVIAAIILALRSCLSDNPKHGSWRWMGGRLLDFFDQRLHNARMRRNWQTGGGHVASRRPDQS